MVYLITGAALSAQMAEYICGFKALNSSSQVSSRE
jgi:hypothetical protein